LREGEGVGRSLSALHPVPLTVDIILRMEGSSVLHVYSKAYQYLI
jgi:hypothetical protein